MKFFENKFLVFAILTTMILVTIETPAWVGIISVLFLIWKWLIEKNYIPNVSRIWTSTLAILLLIFIVLQYRTIFGQEPSTSLLLGLLSLRIIDYQAKRDHLFVVLLGFILLSTKFLFSLDIYWIVPGFLAFSAYWLSLYTTAIEKPLYFLTKLFLYSLPLTALLFFIFPRISIPWAVKSSAIKATSGFTDSLNPGSVSDLINSNELVFRAQFKNSLKPKYSNLYWRGAIVIEPDGLSWKNSKPLALRWHRPTAEALYSYEVVLEPQGHNYLFALDAPVKLYGEYLDTVSSEGRTFRLIQTADKRVVYQAQAHPKINEQEKNLELYKAKPKIDDSVSNLVSRLKKSKDRFKALDDYFQSEGFKYTRQPGSYDEKDGLSDFLLKRKKGFCEHFAGAYATLARHLDIPSRIVNGYQGGEYNLFGDFYKISQKDAHSWVEIYDEEQSRWIRKDPTAWVAPLRIELGAENYFNLPEDYQSSSFNGDIIALRNRMEKDWFFKLSHWSESVNYKWNQWLLDFDSARQSNIFESLPFSSGWTIVIFLVLIFISQLLLRYSRFKERRKSSRLLIEELCAWGEKYGVKKIPSEPPLTYLRKLSENVHIDSELREFLQQAIITYDRCAYQMSSEDEPNSNLLRKKIPTLSIKKV